MCFWAVRKFDKAEEINTMTSVEFSKRPRFVTPKWNVVDESVTVHLNSPTSNVDDVH